MSNPFRFTPGSPLKPAHHWSLSDHFASWRKPDGVRDLKAPPAVLAASGRRTSPQSLGLQQSRSPKHHGPAPRSRLNPPRGQAQDKVHATTAPPQKRFDQGHYRISPPPIHFKVSEVPDAKPACPPDRLDADKGFLERRVQAGERLSQMEPPAPSQAFAVTLHEQAQKYFTDLPSTFGKEPTVIARTRNEKNLRMVEVLLDALAAAQADNEFVSSLDPDFQAGAHQALQDAREQLQRVLDNTPDPVAARQAAKHIRNTSLALRQIYQSGVLRMHAPQQGGPLDRTAPLTRQGLGTDAERMNSQLAKLQQSKTPTVKTGAQRLIARLTNLKPRLFGDMAPASLLDRARMKHAHFAADVKGAAPPASALEALREFDFVSQCVTHLVAADHAGSGMAVLTHSPLADTKAPSVQPLPAGAEIRALDTRNTRALKTHVMQLHQRSAERPEWKSTLAPSLARLAGLIPRLEKMDDVLRLWRMKVLLTPDSEKTPELVRLQDAIGVLDEACVGWINSRIDGTEESREFLLANSRMSVAWDAVQAAARPFV